MRIKNRSTLESTVTGNRSAGRRFSSLCVSYDEKLPTFLILQSHIWRRRSTNEISQEPRETHEGEYLLRMVKNLKFRSFSVQKACYSLSQIKCNARAPRQNRNLKQERKTEKVSNWNPVVHPQSFHYETQQKVTVRKQGWRRRRSIQHDTAPADLHVAAAAVERNRWHWQQAVKRERERKIGVSACAATGLSATCSFRGIDCFQWGKEKAPQEKCVSPSSPLRRCGESSDERFRLMLRWWWEGKWESLGW